MNKENFIVLTGDRPTGSLHLGHYVGSIKNRLLMQDSFKTYLMIADLQALTDCFDNTLKVRESIIDLMLDYLAVGIDPSKTTIFLQSKIPELAELTMIFMNLVSVARLERNPTIKTEIKQKSFLGSIPAGFLCYPVSQAADIALFLAEIVPVGQDQLPMIEQTNEIVEKFNRLYKSNFLKHVKAMIPENGERLLGIDGKAKMSKSLKNAIFLKDSNDEIARKIKMCYTDPDHIYINTPGKIDGNVVFSYLDAFMENKEELEKLKTHYQAGGLADSALKKQLTEILISIIEPIRLRRKSLETDLTYVKAVLHDGTKDAQVISRKNFTEIRKIIGFYDFI